MKNDKLESDRLKFCEKDSPALDFLSIFKTTTFQRRWCNKPLLQERNL